MLYKQVSPKRWQAYLPLLKKTIYETDRDRLEGLARSLMIQRDKKVLDELDMPISITRYALGESWPVYVTDGAKPSGALNVLTFRNRKEADAAGFDWAGRW